MGALEIVLMLSSIAILITWVWFIVLGFKANKLWGFGIVFLFPISPFMFANRFGRKSRKIIYYYIISLLMMLGVQLYIYFWTVEFYPRLADKVITLFPEKKVEPFVEDPVENLNEIEIEIIEQVEETPESETVIELPEEAPKPKPRRSYKVVDISAMKQYVGKKIIITERKKRRKGTLVGIVSGKLEIRERSNSGSSIMKISRHRILKVEVYL